MLLTCNISLKLVLKLKVVKPASFWSFKLLEPQDVEFEFNICTYISPVFYMLCDLHWEKVAIDGFKTCWETYRRNFYFTSGTVTRVVMVAVSTLNLLSLLLITPKTYHKSKSAHALVVWARKFTIQSLQ